MKRQSWILLAVAAAVAVVAAFVAGLAVGNDDDHAGRIGPAMMLDSSRDAPYGWGGGRGPMTDRWPGSMMDDLCPGWSGDQGDGPGAGSHGWMMGPRFDPDR